MSNCLHSLALLLLVLAAAAVVSGGVHVKDGAAQTPAPAENCTAEGLASCGQYGPCYNTSTQGCCGIGQPTCFRKAICDSNTEMCCMPSYGCSYGGSPTCCDKNGQCCSARHGTMCAPPGGSCCPSMGSPAACPRGTQCCTGYWSSPCCGPEQTCCTPYTQNPVNQQGRCCPSSQICNAVGTCVNQTQNCTSVPGMDIAAAVQPYTTLTGLLSVTQCCKACVRINAGYQNGGICAVAVAEQLGEFEFDCRVYNQTGAQVPSASGATTWVLLIAA